MVNRWLLAFGQLNEPIHLSTYQSHSDQELLDSVRNGEERAFAELFRRYWRSVHKMAHARVRSKAVTEEIVQDLFLSLWSKRSSLNIKNLPSYFYTAVKHKTLNYIESRVVQQKYWDYYKRFVPQQECTTEENVEMDELMEVFERSMERLPEKSKLAFKMNRLEGRSIAEIAKFLSLSEKAIQYHITKSSQQLKLFLKDFIVLPFLILNLAISLVR
jgi:RNA polymerase sigma-70 factor (family 1)